MLETELYKSMDTFKSKGPEKPRYIDPLIIYGDINSFKSACIDTALIFYKNKCEVEYRKC